MTLEERITRLEDIEAIRAIGYKRCYEYVELRGLLNIFTLRKTTFLDALRKKK